MLFHIQLNLTLLNTYFHLLKEMEFIFKDYSSMAKLLFIFLDSYLFLVH